MNFDYINYETGELALQNITATSSEEYDHVAPCEPMKSNKQNYVLPSR